MCEAKRHGKNLTHAGYSGVPSQGSAERDSTKRDDLSNVDTLGDTGPYLHCNAAIHVNTGNGVRPFGPYSQFSRAVHFLQYFLTDSVIILTTLEIGTAQVLSNANPRGGVCSKTCLCRRPEIQEKRQASKRSWREWHALLLPEPSQQFAWPASC